jgi:hypothetical protein
VESEGFAAGSTYREPTKKCFCCGRLIPTEGVEGVTEGVSRLYCSEDCIDVYARYRIPYLKGE